MTHPLFQRYNMLGLELQNRVVMAPLTRRRAENEDLKANDLMALYYRQRASAGLIIAEGSQISPQGYGYTHSPGCHSAAQTEAWKKVTAAVHEQGGKIFLQLWHVGPFSHRLLQPQQKDPLSASRVKPDGEVLTPEGRLPYGYSRAMTIEEIHQSAEDFAKAACNAIEAGFDGVEIHAAHAYVIDQFLRDGTNARTDDFGGPVENRARFLFLVLEHVLKNIPASQTGIRLSPTVLKPGMTESDPHKTYGYIIERLNDYNLAYLHISEMMTPEERLQKKQESIIPFCRGLYKGTLISCGGHSLHSAKNMIDKQQADLIAFGKPFISNPDLVARLQKNAPLTPWDKETFYHGAEKGYTDYPFMK